MLLVLRLFVYQSYEWVVKPYGFKSRPLEAGGGGGGGGSSDDRRVS
jgi:hypothetical protein